MIERKSINRHFQFSRVRILEYRKHQKIAKISNDHEQYSCSHIRIKCLTKSNEQSKDINRKYYPCLHIGNGSLKRNSDKGCQNVN